MCSIEIITYRRQEETNNNTGTGAVLAEGAARGGEVHRKGVLGAPAGEAFHCGGAAREAVLFHTLERQSEFLIILGQIWSYDQIHHFTT